MITDKQDSNRAHLNNRRNDVELRTAIDSVQQYLFDPDATDQLTNVLLTRVMKLTNSSHGTAIMVNNGTAHPATKDPESVPIPELKLSLRRTYNNELVPNISNSHIQFRQIIQQIKNKVINPLPIYYNSPIPPEHQRLLADPDHTSAILIIPVISQNNLKNVIVLTKEKGSYSANEVTRIIPLLGAASCAIRTAESVKQDFPQLETTIRNNHYLSSFIAASPLATFVVREDGTIIANNKAAETTFQDDQNNLKTRKIKEFLPNYDSLFQWSNQESDLDFKEHLFAPKLWEDQVAIRGSGKEFLANISVFRYSEGVENYTTLQIQDITSMRASAEEYRTTAQHFSALKHLVPVGILHVNSNWSCVYANDMWHELSGLQADETLDNNWINAVHEKDIKRLLEDLQESMRNGTDYNTEIRLVTPLGKKRWIEFNARTLFDSSGFTQGFLATFADITERLETQEHLKHVAEYDALTGLANKNLLYDRLQQEFYASERSNCDVSIMFIDLDGFKDINDTLGHDVGDALLVKVGERLQNSLRKNDTVARFGGDEFVILLGINESENNAEAAAAKIVNEVAKPYLINNEEIFVTVSIGIAHGRHVNSSPQQILKEADTALYLAKREGKNNYQTFNQKLSNETKLRREMINNLRRAVERKAFFIEYQPQASISNSETVGVEALIRYKHPTKGVYQPINFITLLEETGLIIDVGNWVIESACKQLKYWQETNTFDKNIFISINVSPKQISNNSIVDTIRKACEKYNVSPSNLVIEITESVLIKKETIVEEILNELKDLGVQLALDDFGTGYSSLSYLQNYPFDHIKIDKSFVLDILTDSNDEKIIKGIIALAHSLGLKVTAEGVESEGALKVLKKYECDFFQGFHLSKPTHPSNVVFGDFGKKELPLNKAV
ncbi:MAG: EAL domain-containing protein [Gammaproteobacteria bacterium]